MGTKIRKPKYETKPNFKYQDFETSSFASFPTLDFLLVSDFGFRISDFGSRKIGSLLSGPVRQSSVPTGLHHFALHHFANIFLQISFCKIMLGKIIEFRERG